eukprot:31342-Pelagococcus_subviridis.AAC.41
MIWRARVRRRRRRRRLRARARRPRPRLAKEAVVHGLIRVALPRRRARRRRRRAVVTRGAAAARDGGSSVGRRVSAVLAARGRARRASRRGRARAHLALQERQRRAARGRRRVRSRGRGGVERDLPPVVARRAIARARGDASTRSRPGRDDVTGPRRRARRARSPRGRVLELVVEFLVAPLQPFEHPAGRWTGRDETR